MPVSLAEVADRAGVSRSLIYSHFPTQHDLMNGVLNLQIPILEKVIAETKNAESDESALVNASLKYFDELVERGPTVALAPNDSFLTGHVNSEFSRAAQICLLNLSRPAGRLFRVSPREALSSVLMLKALPDEAAMLAWKGEILKEVCRETLHASIGQAIQSMTFHESIYPAKKAVS